MEPRSRPVRPVLAGPILQGLLVLAVVLGGVACTAEDATPIDPSNPPTTANLTDVSHSLLPTPQMEAAAEQQCLDDPDLDQGYVRAVDPATDEPVSEITVDCAEVRADG